MAGCSHQSLFGAGSHLLEVVSQLLDQRPYDFIRVDCELGPLRRVQVGALEAGRKRGEEACRLLTHSGHLVLDRQLDSAHTVEESIVFSELVGVHDDVFDLS